MPSLSDSDRLAILKLARDAINKAVCQREILAPIPTDGIFGEKHGLFVTLHVRGRLRGCIGVIDAHEPLGEAVVRCAASAALEDPRFPAIRPDDLPELHIAVSLLSPHAPIPREAIEVGRHGLLISRGQRRGVLLPQVAIEHDLSAEQFLAETCKKAGLAPDAWRSSDTIVEAFTCEVFCDDLNSPDKVQQNDPSHK